MLAKRVIACLDVIGRRVVKGVRFREHQDIADAVDLARRYAEEGVDELVLCDIRASIERRTVSAELVAEVARELSIPFCVAGGLRSLADAEKILNSGADKISLNSPALETSDLINQLSRTFGAQAVVIGIDSKEEDDDYTVFQYTGSERTCASTTRLTREWIAEIADRGAGEIVLNCMNKDGVQSGFDQQQLRAVGKECRIPMIASGGSGQPQDFVDVFENTSVSGALGASIFHLQKYTVIEVEEALARHTIPVRKIREIKG